MIRPLTCVCLLLAAGSGLYLYQAKHQAQLQDREIARLLKAADAARARAGVLRAEYALLNDPERLATLAQTHLPLLRATEPKQFTTLAELERRLPPVGPPPSTAPEIVEPGALQPADTAPIVQAATTPPVAATPVAAPTVAAPAVAAPAVAAPAVAAPAVAAPAVAKPRPARVRVAAVRPAALPAVAPLSGARIVAVALPDVTFAAVPPMPARAKTVHVPSDAYARFATPVATPSEAVARIARGGAVGSGVPVAASALGMARSLVGPGVLGPASAATLTPVVSR